MVEVIGGMLGMLVALVVVFLAMLIWNFIQYGTWHPYGSGGAYARRQRRLGLID